MGLWQSGSSKQKSCKLQDIVGSDTVLDKSVRHLSRYFAHGFQAGTVTRNNELGPQSLQFMHRSDDYWLKESTC